MPAKACRKIRMRGLLLLAACLALLSATAGAKPWVAAYYAGWQLAHGSDGYLPSSVVDYSCVTHVMLFSLVPRADGSLDSSSNFLLASGSAAVIRAAHAAGAKVLVSVGGWGSESGFLSASGASVLSTFVANLVGIVTRSGLDGIDLDWEPLGGGDATNFGNLAAALRSALQAVSPDLLLTTTCIEGNQALMASVQKYFDQINIMTYDMSGNYSGWVSWFNSPLFNPGLEFPGTGSLLPSIDAVVKEFRAAGVAPEKTGIGAELGGTVWTGLTLPDQALSGLSSISYDVPLYTSNGSGILQKYYNPSYYHWDSAAQSGYLSVPGLLGLLGSFVSYDDSNSIRAKAAYIREQGLGGIILYELGMGYPGGGRFPMLNSVKAAFADTSATLGVDEVGPPVPRTPTLEQNYPNPFNPATTLTFTIPGAGHVSLRVFNVLGQEVARLADGPMQEGSHAVTWNGSSFASGVYVARLSVGGFERSIEMLLLK